MRYDLIMGLLGITASLTLILVGSVFILTGSALGYGSGYFLSEYWNTSARSAHSELAGYKDGGNVVIGVPGKGTTGPKPDPNDPLNMTQGYPDNSFVGIPGDPTTGGTYNTYPRKNHTTSPRTDGR